MSIPVTISTGIAARADASRDQKYLWTTVLILVAIAACAIAASFYVGAPVLDGSLVGP